MAATVEISGTRRPIGLTPADTSPATMLTAGTERPVLVGFIVANSTGTAAAATVMWGDGTTDYPIIAGKMVPANDSILYDVLLPLREGGTIKVTSGTGNALTFTLAVVEFGGMLGGEHAH